MSQAFPDYVQKLFRAEGVEPLQPAWPDNAIVGRFGWSLEQAQGTTATFASGQIVNFAADSGVAGTVARTGYLLDSLSTSSNPKVVAFPESAKVLVSIAAAVENTSDFMLDLAENLYIGWGAPGAKLRPYSLLEAVGTVVNSDFENDTATTTASRRITVKAIPIELPGLIADLEDDTFGLYCANAVSLPTGATVKLSVVFNGALYAKANGDIPRLVGANGCQNVAQDEAIIRRAKTRAMMALRPLR